MPDVFVDRYPLENFGQPSYELVSWSAPQFSLVTYILPYVYIPEEDIWLVDENAAQVVDENYNYIKDPNP